MEYDFRRIEKEWQQKWRDSKIYEVSDESSKPKCYVLDMFPYPSGAGLHVGHPLGYIASDIYARYKRLKGFNVLHPMGYDSFGLPAEQYALETGQHPAVTTEKNINTFRSQLDNIGFCFDWSRELRTSNPKYYKWTQWIFLEIFNSWYDKKQNKARKIDELIKIFEEEGSNSVNSRQSTVDGFSAEEWEAFDENKQQEILMNYRLAYSAFGEVNWCKALGTVLANDEVINGVSERGGHPVVKKKMRQWYLRITDYAERLLQGLETVEFSDAMKEMQKNWIGKSEGAEIIFRLTPNPSPSGEGENPDVDDKGTKSLLGHFFKTADKKHWRVLKDMSRENRQEKTKSENILWQKLRNNSFGYKVRRQHVIDGFIIDFALLEKKLLIEIDGGYHKEQQQKEYDEAREEVLKECGYSILRFTNEEVLSNVAEVVKKIKEELEPKINSISPLSVRRGAGGKAKTLELKVYTTRPDTIFGVDFMVLAPEHELVNQITTPDQKDEIEQYLTYVKSRSERERLAEVKQITGAFTGAYAINPFDGKEIPVWISEYVLAGYGTGAIMAVPCGDQRDYNFAKHFNIPITNIIGDNYNGEEANSTKEATLTNSDFLNGMIMKDAMPVVLNKIEEMGIGKRRVNYRMRDAGFSRQRYWGEPFPIIYKDGIAYALDEKDLPVELPHVESYSPGPEGEGPLANITNWIHLPSPDGEGTGMRRETNTMPGYAGSSWYFLRYMDPHNDYEFADKKVTDYWNQVDVYVGGTEHAVGHLLYSRLWTKILFDLGYISFDEPFKKLVNQGMITGRSYFFQLENVYSEKIISKKLSNDTTAFRRFKYGHNYIENGSKLTKKIFLKYLSDQGLDSNDYKVHWLNDGQEDYIFLKEESEKMSKSKFNVDNPNDIIDKYGADTFRMYEMFLGPVEQSKPWDTKGIEGVHRFLKKLWRLFYDDVKGPIWTSPAPSLNEREGGEATDAELKVLHKTIKKIEEDTEHFSYNTAISAFMVCVNELADIKCHKKEILEPLLILITPYAPHIAEELYQQIKVSPTGGDLEGASILDASFPKFESKYLIESEKEYPVSINGKMRTLINISLEAGQPEVEKIVLQNDIVQKWLEGKSPKKIIFVKNKMVNIVV